MENVSRPALTLDESQHVENGGRLFIVEELAGSLWRVLCVKAATCRVLLKPDGAKGYAAQQDAFQHAAAIAALSEDSPMIRDNVYKRLEL